MNAIKMKRILINICKYVLLIFAATWATGRLNKATSA